MSKGKEPKCPTCYSDSPEKRGTLEYELTGGAGRVNLHRERQACPDPFHEPPIPAAQPTEELGTCAMFFKVHDGRHTKRDDCLGWQAEPIEWNPEIERVRKEMMRRFSDKLSMEEIASFAYETFGQPAQSGMGKDR